MDTDTPSPARTLIGRLQAAFRLTDEYGRKITLRFMAFLFATSFSATLIAETVAGPQIV